jgi:hypothetical protein
MIHTTVLPRRPDRKAAIPVQAASGAPLIVHPAGFESLGRRLKAHLRTRGGTIRRTLPRDLGILLLLFTLTRFFGIGIVLTDSVHTRLALVIKGVQPDVGELAVFGYTGRTVDRYYEDNWLIGLRRQLGQPVRLDGPRPGEGFIKVVAGVAGDRIELDRGHVFLDTRRGRLDMGACKPVSRHGVPLHPIAPQVIPAGFVYMFAPHVDALDSRYDVMGLVPVGAIVGKGIALW